MFQTKVIEKIKTRVLCSINFSPENRAVYETLWQDAVQAAEATDVNTIRRAAIYMPYT
jgi:hypothetical protein